MSACCFPGCLTRRADVMVSVPSYQQDACWGHVNYAVDIIDRNDGSDEILLLGMSLAAVLLGHVVAEHDGHEDCPMSTRGSALEHLWPSVLSIYRLAESLEEAGIS